MIYLILCAYAYVHGQTNAFPYSRRGAEALARNEHIDLTLERLLAWIGVLAGVVYGVAGGWVLSLVELTAAFLAFSFWHNGAYYVMRARISKGGARLGKDMHQYHWQHQSPTTTARYDFSYRQRLWLLLASLAVLAGGYGVVLF